MDYFWAVLGFRLVDVRYPSRRAEVVEFLGILTKRVSCTMPCVHTEE